MNDKYIFRVSATLVGILLVSLWLSSNLWLFSNIPPIDLDTCRNIIIAVVILGIFIILHLPIGDAYGGF